MSLRLEGRIGTGLGALDTGIVDIAIRSGPEGPLVYTFSGRNGGISAWRLSDPGALVAVDQVVFPAQISGISGGGFLALEAGALPDTGARLVFGAGGGLAGYALDPAGGLAGPVHLPAVPAGATVAALAGGVLFLADATGGTLTAHAPQAGGGLTALAANAVPEGAVAALRPVFLGGTAHLLLAGQGNQGVTSYRIDSATGALAEAGHLGAAHGLGVQAPTAMQLVQAHGETWVLLAAAGSSSISVMRLGTDGALFATDHVLDTLHTRFGAVQALEVVQVGAHVFVLAGGGDHGLSLFTLLPGGRLLHLQSIADAPGLGLHNVAAIAAAQSGDRLHVFASSQRDAGLSHFSLSIASLGEVIEGSATHAQWISGTTGDDILRAGADRDTLSGGAGDDILIAGPGETWMRGGPGADVFVMRAGSGTTRVLDYERGIDRLDLSDWFMLRDPGQLRIFSVASGARVEFRDEVLIIAAADHAPLTLADLFPQGFPWPDRMLVGVSETPLAEAQTGLRLIGGPGDDTLRGGPGDDWLEVHTGNNRLIGGHGDDRLIGGLGHDTLFGGPGNDTLIAGAGDNLLNGRADDDLLIGGPGNDTLRGGPGSDTLDASAGGDNVLNGGIGHDLLIGGPGNDTLRGLAGRDTLDASAGGDNLLDGGLGNDLLIGGSGNDTLLGGPGHDTLDASAGGDNLLEGGGGADLLIGGSGRDTLLGGPGHDTLRAGAGDTLLNGGSGNDRLIGGPGNDTLIGGLGNDRLTGGPGADTFIFARNHGRNTITDFTPQEGDRLLLRAGLWQGELDAEAVVARFAAPDAAGDVLFLFDGGEELILRGYGTLTGLADYIDIG